MSRSPGTLLRPTRDAAVAGSFYPGRRDQLRSTVRRLLDDAGAATVGPAPKAVIAPHAGYVYSGPVAASAFRRVAALRGRVQRVVLIGPSHFVPFRGLARSGAAAFATPLGSVEVDADAESLLEPPVVFDLPRAHHREHCLEVELPFLQEVLDGFQIVPLVVGEASAEEVAAVLDSLWGGDETLVVVSSDLSHYLDYDAAALVDRATSRAIEELRWDAIEPEHACGWAAIRGLLLAAGRRGLGVETLDLRNSGDTAGPRDAVVGYGAWALGEGSPAPPGRESMELAGAADPPAIPRLA